MIWQIHCTTHMKHSQENYTDMYDMQTSEFNLTEHLKRYVNYTEVIIFPDGHIEYAIPSHQEKLISILCNTEHKSRQQVIDETPPEYYFDWLNYLLNKTGCISVWFDFIITPKQMTDAQNDTIINLIQSGAVRLDKNKNEPSIYLKYSKYARK